MKDKYKYADQSEPMVSKNVNNNHHATKSSGVRSADKDAKKYATDDEKNYEVGIVEIASNLSDLSGSTGDVDSNPDAKQMSTRNADSKEFEILIQAKHAEACKAMGVSASFASN
jgi:hypothetical protein